MDFGRLPIFFAETPSKRWFLRRSATIVPALCDLAPSIRAVSV